jgi:hypothetical protein
VCDILAVENHGHLKCRMNFQEKLIELFKKLIKKHTPVTCVNFFSKKKKKIKVMPDIHPVIFCFVKNKTNKNIHLKHNLIFTFFLKQVTEHAHFFFKK